MEKTKTKTKLLSCMFKGPGPIYKLPPLTGYIKHDPTHKIQPAYTIPKRNLIIRHSVTPGPNKYNLYNKTNRGLAHSPAYTVGAKKPYKIEDIGPSPADYKVEGVPLVNHQKRSPAYTIRWRNEEKIQNFSPGPNTALPSCIGPRIPDKRAAAAYTISFSKPKDSINNTPGPAAYKKVNIDVVKRKYPAYSMRKRGPSLKRDDVPGPKYMYSNNRKRAPAFVFGMKHSQCTVVPMTPNDDF